MIILNCFKKILGRICSVISKLLIYLKNFNNKIILLYNINFIIIKNKKYFKHSGYIGKLKLIKSNKNFFYIKKCIFNMLPKNKNRVFLMKKIFFLNNI